MSGNQRAAWVVAVGVAAGLAGLLIVEERVSAQTAGGDRPVVQGAAGLAQRLGVSSCTVQSLAVAGRAEVMTLSMVIDGRVVDLVVEPITLRAPGFVVKVEREGLGWVAEEPTPEMNFAVRGVDASRGVSGRLSVVRGSWRGVIDLGDGGPLHWVQPLADSEEGAAWDKHVVFAGSAVLADGHGCPGGVFTGIVEAAAAARAKGTVPGCGLQAQIAFDTDVLFYNLNGSSIATTTADIESVLNGMNLVYARDTQVNFVSSGIFVRTATSPYNNPDPSVMLDQMQVEWTANQTGVVRDLAHLMTGRDLTGSTIGLAFDGVVCSTFAYGLSQSRYSANFSNRVAVTCHEVGHNFSASHCNGDSDCAIMCASVGACPGGNGRFSFRSINEIKAHASTRACVVVNNGLAAAVPPFVGNDSVVGAAGSFIDLDVLANDLDGNCDLLSIQSFPASTTKGTITRVVGGGFGGRDTLRYTANSNASGTDTFSVVIADGTGLTSTSTATVTIPLPKAPDHSGGVRGGISGNYYRLQGQFSVPDFTPLSFFSFGQFTNTPINWASTAGNFSNSGRADNLSVLATATLNVPTAGSWTFFTQSDEGSLLYIDGVLVVNNDFAHTSQERSGVVASLSAGNHTLRVEYFERTGPAELIVRWQGPGTAKQVIPGSRLSGLIQQYFELLPPIQSIPDFGGPTAIASDTPTQVNFPSSTGNFAASGRAADVGARFTGLVLAPTAGLYTFYLESDDGSRLSLGSGQLVVNNDGVHGMTEVRGPVNLLAGWHAFTIDYFSAGQPSGLIARYEGPGIAKQVIPASAFGRPALQCNAADLGGQGGVAGFDGVLDNNDFIVFINFFFAGDARADFGRQGGVPPGDGLFNNNDFVVFIDTFFAPCN